MREGGKEREGREGGREGMREEEGIRKERDEGTNKN